MQKNEPKSLRDLLPASQKNKYAQVLVDIPELDTKTFSYLIPEELYDFVQPGVPVLVPFGNKGATNGFVVGFSNYLPEHIKAKSIYEVLDDEPLFDLEYLKLLEWVANYYCCSLQIVLDAAIPSNLLSKTKRVASLVSKEPQDLNKTQQRIYDFLKEKNEYNIRTLQKKTKVPSAKFYAAMRQLKDKGVLEVKTLMEAKSAHKTEKFVKLAENYSKEGLTKQRIKIVEALEEINAETRQSEFLKIAGTTASTLKKMAESNLIEIFEKKVFRNPAEIFKSDDQNKFFNLTACQDEALSRILSDKEKGEPILLYGITGSGKTEVYMHAVREVLKQGKSAIILAPEILLASQVAMKFAARFGAENVAIWHSSISEGEKFDVWKKLRSGDIKIVVGARSGIFAPIKDPGIIIIDEEHESSYKQTSPTPRYNAKTIAIERAKRAEATVVLGTATPDVATFFRAKNTGNIVSLPERVGTSELAQVSIVNMQNEVRDGNKSIFSRILKKNLVQTFAAKKQAILLINRRGFSTYGQCGNCGFTPKCEKCEIPLILHKTENKLRCHYCSYETEVYDICPSCHNGILRYFGMGTQRVEEIFKKEFPQINVKRIDSDIMSKKNLHIKLLEEFAQGEIDALIGTQMIAKGLDVPNVTLVGVINADSLFNIPDFRGTERGFQLLTQVAGRAGRGDFRGKVYFQTYEPDFFAVNHAKDQDFIRFYNYEIQARNEHDYPPFSNIIRFIISSKSEIKAIKFATDVQYRLKLLTDKKGLTERLEVLGPTRCVIPRIREEYRFHILIKNTLGEKGHFIVNSLVKQLKIPQEIKFLIDVDPSDML